jgi:hypothetical protein
MNRGERRANGPAPGQEERELPMSEVSVLPPCGTWHVEKGSAHRGVLTADEWLWLDLETVVSIVEQQLGCTRAELDSIYVQGRKSVTQRELRQRVDARLLELQRSGGNLSALARLLGWRFDESKRTCPKMARALARARATESVA